jgi:hypothetical protein
VSIKVSIELVSALWVSDGVRVIGLRVCEIPLLLLLGTSVYWCFPLYPAGLFPSEPLGSL